MRKKAAKSLASTVRYYMDEKRYSDAAHIFLYMTIAFDLDETLFATFKKDMENLPEQEQGVLTDYIHSNVNWAGQVIDKLDHDLQPEQKKRLGLFKKYFGNSLVEKSKSYIEQKNIPEAIKCIEKALELDPENEKIESELIRLTGARIFRVITDGVLNLIYWTGQKIILPLVGVEKTIIASGKKILGIIKAKEAMGLLDTYGDEIIHEEDDFILEVKRGIYEDKLIIRPKE